MKKTCWKEGSIIFDFRKIEIDFAEAFMPLGVYKYDVRSETAYNDVGCEQR
jgi:hypothetical protein